MMDALGWIATGAILVGLAWADRINRRIVRAQTELWWRRQARQAYEADRRAASVPLQGAKR